jgi:N-acylglucosamine 2-epimerase
MAMDLVALRDVYRKGLLDDTLAFWFPRCVDEPYGGYITSLDQDGAVLQTDKSVWFQGRVAWMLSTLYRTIEPRKQWLQDARSGIEFMERHCFDRDGRMFFSVTREGKPLRKRRYVFSEFFAIIAFAAYGVAAEEPRYVQHARDLLSLVLHHLETPGLLPPKVDPQTRPMKGLAVPMITLVTCQELRDLSNDPRCEELIDSCIREIERDFLKPQFQCLLETVGPQGQFIDSFDGRQVNPGHSIEAAWFILHEARRRNDARVVRLGCTILDWSLRIGWDEQYGGIYYFRDCRGLPCVEYWHDMKFWWPHNEAIIATLLAWQITGDEKYRHWHAKVHDWSYAHFPDAAHGEWFGYLHRDGSVSTRLKGNLFKGPFHLPRMQWYCWQRVEEMIAAGQ